MSYNGPLTFELNFNTSTPSSLQPQPSNTCTLTALLRQSAFPDMTLFSNNNDFTMCQLQLQQSNSSSNFTCRLSIEYPLIATWYYLAVSSDCNYLVDVLLPNTCLFPALQPPLSNSTDTNQTMSNLFDSSFLFRTFEQLTNASNTALYCSKYSEPIETFRFIGPTYFSVKYYFNSNYNRSNALLVRDEKKPYFIEFLVDLANNGGTLNFYLANNLIFDPGYVTASATSTASMQQQQPNSSTNSDQNQQMKNRVVGYDLHNRAKEFNLANVRVMLKACLLFNSMDYRNCPYGYAMSVQSFTNIFTNLQLSVPYPYMGKWYLAVWKECFDLNSK